MNMCFKVHVNRDPVPGDRSVISKKPRSSQKFYNYSQFEKQVGMPCDVIIVCKFMFVPVTPVLSWVRPCFTCLFIPSTKERARHRDGLQHLFEKSVNECGRLEKYPFFPLLSLPYLSPTSKSVLRTTLFINIARFSALRPSSTSIYLYEFTRKINLLFRWRTFFITYPRGGKL